MARTLVGLLQWQDETVRRCAIEILRMLAIHNVEICCHAGGIKALCDTISDPKLEVTSEDVTYTLIYLLNEPESRNQIYHQFDIEQIFSCFSDIERDYSSKAKKENYHSMNTRLRLSSRAIIKFFKSWSGLIYLGYEKRSMKSLVEALKQPIKFNVRECIFDLFDEILKIGFNLCPSENDNGPVTLRRSLAQYAYIQTKVLLDAGLYNALLILSSVDDLKISEKAQKQLRDLSYIM